MNVLEEIKEDIQAIDLLDDWLGAGGIPVSAFTATLRSKTCLEGDDGKPCSLNKAPNWWDRVKSRIADYIRGQLEIKHNMGLAVADEHKLHMCAACGCCLRLKIWVPNEQLKRHTDAKTINKTPAFCWMRKQVQIEL